MATPTSTQKMPRSWPCTGSGLKHEVVEEVAAEQQARDADAAIQQHAQRHHRLHQRFGHDLARICQAVDQRIQHHAGGADDAGLEPAAGAEIAVELHVQRKEQDERNQQLGNDAQDDVVSHGLRHFHPGFVSGAASPQQGHHARAGREHDDGLAEGVVAAVAGEHGGHYIGHAGFFDSIVQVARRHMLVDRCLRIGERRQTQRAVDQQTAHGDRECQRQPWLAQWFGLFALAEKERAEKEHRGDACPTAASVIATSTASSATSTVAVRKL